MLLHVIVKGSAVEAVVDTASQSTIICYSTLHLIAPSLRHLGKPIPRLVKPHCYKLYGKGGEESLRQMVGVYKSQSQPDSSQACLPGSNVLPCLEVKIQYHIHE